MKTTYFLIILIFFQSCSFDNKTGIWESESESVKRKDQFKEFKTLSSRKDPFSKTIKIEDKNNTNIFFDDFRIRRNFWYLNKKKVVINKNIVVHKHLCMTNSSGPTKDKDLK